MYAKNTYGKVEVWLYSFLTLTQDLDEWLVWHPGCFVVQGHSPWYLLNWRMCGLQSRSGHFGVEKKNLLTPPVIELWFLDRPAWNIVTTWYCRDRVSSCNISAVQQDTQSVLMSEFYSALMLARHVSDLTGPSSGAFCTSCIRIFGMW